MYAKGTPKNSIRASSKYIIFSASSWMMRTALTCHSGGLRGIVLARLAGGVDAALEHRVVGVGAVRARGRHSRFVDGFETQRIDETVAEIVAEIELLAVADLAVGLGQACVAFRMQSLAALVVDHLVGFQRRPVVVDLHVADGGNQLVGVVVFDLVGLNEHLPVGVLLGDHALAGGLRPQLLAER